MTFSIIIPAYKGKFLEEAIRSVLGQTFGDYELVIVDDCSPEGLKEIVAGFTDGRLCYYRNEANIGARNLAIGWNKCLELCNGDYVICMGDDDRLSQKCLELYAKAIESHPEMDVFHGRTEIIDENGKVINLQESRPAEETAVELLLGRLSGRRKFQYIGDFCFRRASLAAHGGFALLPYAWGSDDLTAFREAMAQGVLNVNDICFQYRSSRYSISQSGNEEEKICATVELCREYTALLKKYVPQNRKDRAIMKLCIRLLSRYLRHRIELHIAYDITAKPSNIKHWSKSGYRRALIGAIPKSILYRLKKK